MPESCYVVSGYMTHFSKEGEGKGFPKGKTRRGNAHAEERDDVAITAKSRDARGGEAAVVVIGREPIA